MAEWLKRQDWGKRKRNSGYFEVAVIFLYSLVCIATILFFGELREDILAYATIAAASISGVAVVYSATISTLEFNADRLIMELEDAGGGQDAK